MPYIDVDLDVDEFLSYCSKRDIDEIIDALIEDEYLPSDVSRKNTLKSAKSDKEVKIGKMESSFVEKLEGLSKKYYTLSSEDEETLELIFKKYL